MSNLAVTYSHLARHAEALQLKEEVLELRRRILGSEHPFTLLSMNTLAATYSTLYRYAEAVQLQEEVVELSKRVLPIGHPDLALYTGKLSIYRKEPNQENVI
ncbi:hypothetical protein DL96DRAFT_1584901, partial [Flagelloscypha sp. PMI_526]